MRRGPLDTAARTSFQPKSTPSLKNSETHMAERQPHDPLPTHIAQWRDQVRRDYGIEDAPGLALLEQAALALHRAEQARELLAKEGLVTRDRFDQPKPHPAAVIARDAEASFRAALRDLQLDVEPARPVGRPPGV